MKQDSKERTVCEVSPVAPSATYQKPGVTDLGKWQALTLFYSVPVTGQLPAFGEKHQG